MRLIISDEVFLIVNINIVIIIIAREVEVAELGLFQAMLRDSSPRLENSNSNKPHTS